MIFSPSESIYFSFYFPLLHFKFRLHAFFHCQSFWRNWIFAVKNSQWLRKLLSIYFNTATYSSLSTACEGRTESVANALSLMMETKSHLIQTQHRAPPPHTHTKHSIVTITLTFLCFDSTRLKQSQLHLKVNILSVVACPRHSASVSTQLKTENFRNGEIFIFILVC